MPSKALVALGVALTLLALSTPAWSSGAGEQSSPAKTALTAIDEMGLEQTQVLTLEEASSRVLKKNPGLSSLSKEVSARAFDTLQAGLRPNPELSVEVENVGGSGEFSGTDAAETTARVSQLLELGDKRERRRALGRLEEEVAEREYQIARADLLAQTAERFSAVLATQKRVEVAEEQLDLTQKVLQTVEDRIKAGKAADIERVRFGTLVAEARLRQQQARQELAAARNALATLWGSEEADFSAAKGNLDAIDRVPEWPELTSLLEESPAMALQQSASRRADRLQDLERANRIPDLTLSLGVKNDRVSGDNALLAEVAIPLPVFDRNQGAVAAARIRKERAEDEVRATRLRKQAELLEVWRKLRSTHSEIEVLREEILPAAQQAFDGVTYGYRAGKFGFLDVLDAEQSLFEAKNRYVEALSSYHQALSEAERLLGRKIVTDEASRLHNETERGQS